MIIGLRGMGGSLPGCKHCLSIRFILEHIILNLGSVVEGQPATLPDYTWRILPFPEIVCGICKQVDLNSSITSGYPTFLRASRFLRIFKIQYAAGLPSSFL